MNEKLYISHLYYDTDWKIQTNQEHCAGVAKLAGEFAARFGYQNWGELSGLLHDRGKERTGYQQYIRKNSGLDTTIGSHGPKDHSYIGAIIAHNNPLDAAYWLSNAIAGHHRGLYDLDELKTVIQTDIPSEVDPSLPDVKLTLPPVKPDLNDFSHIGRMLFSCLVDADWLDTERFMNKETADIRGNFDSLPILKKRLDDYLESLTGAPDSLVNRTRREVQELCRDAASKPKGFFELTVPTGGGKTLASVVWALNHAIYNGMERIIIAIPFTSIIVQTADTLRKIFGEKNVVEHHSAISDDKVTDTNRLACENWDAPIIVTTNVQLFESIYSNKTSRCRKLHSICNCVVVLDEVQSLPRTHLQPVVNAMKSYAKLFGASFLLCTASQPVLDGEWQGRNQASFSGLDRSRIYPIIADDLRLHERMRRASITIDRDLSDIPGIAERISGHRQVLCIVNTRRIALELFEALPKEDCSIYHLSRFMCAAHILDVIARIKEALIKDEPVKVISTQLIEAGVDIDFLVVYRQMAGLDSILQAAGRCNREGRADNGDTIVFRLKTAPNKGDLKTPAEVMEDMIDIYPDADWFSPSAMRDFYRMLYGRTPYFDKNDITGLLSNPTLAQYETASERFNLIDNQGETVYVNYGDAPALIEKIRYTGPTRSMMRKLGRYGVTIHTHYFNELSNGGLVEEVAPGIFYIPLEAQYDRLTGLKLSNEYLEQTFIL